MSLCEKSRDEVILLRAHYAESKKTFELYESALGKAEEAGQLSAQEIDKLKVEVGQLRESLGSERKALEFKDKEAKKYETALAKMTKSRNFYKSLTKTLVAVTTISVAIAATVILKE